MIEVKGLGIKLGEFTLRDVNLKVEEQEYFVVLGPTGSGKTVLVECIVGLHKPSSGRIFLDGRDVTSLKPEERKVAYVPQDYCLFPHMTVKQNIEFGMRRQRMPENEIREAVERLTEMTHITDILGRHPLTLSGGEKQRAALCRALAVKPRLLLLDEPLAAVDERTREMMCQELKAVQKQIGTTTIHVSHNFEETLAVADKIGVFERGGIVQTGTPHEIFRRPDNEFVAAFTGTENIIPLNVVRRSCQINGSKIGLDTDYEGEARLVIRPEDIRLHLVGLSDIENSLTGSVASLVDKGPLFKVIIKTGDVSWSALISRRECEDLGIVAGSAICVELPINSIHVLK